MVVDRVTTEVTNNAAQNRFELWLNGDLVGILGYWDVASDGGRTPVRNGAAPVVSFLHTVIVEDFGHRGLAAVMVRRALDSARDYGWRVRPVCTYLQQFVTENPEYRDILVAV